MPPRIFADAAAIGVSALCLVHCLAVPMLLTLVPWLVPEFFVDESFHMIAVLIALPVSALALAGTLQARPMIVAIAAVGIMTLFGATQVHEEALETTLTVTGALLVVCAHVWNLKLRTAD